MPPRQRHPLRDREILTALEEANQICRSAWQIAERDGRDTNWRAFRMQLDKALKNQHALLHPHQRHDPNCAFVEENKDRKEARIERMRVALLNVRGVLERERFGDLCSLNDDDKTVTEIIDAALKQ